MDYREIIEQNRDAMLASLQNLVQIPSVQSAPVRKPDGTCYPFGQAVEDALEYMLNLGRELGFTVKNVDHYCGHIEWKAENPDAEIFAIAGHLDVVPEGNGWQHDPYAVTIDGNRMFGRGTIDDKGPVLACLYAMKALKDAGYRPSRTIRLILGLDEETGSDSVSYYLQHEKMPDLGITPDGDFPLTNGEMGILTFQLVSRMKKYSPKDGLVLSRLTAGTAPNIVPNEAKAVVACSDKSIFERIRAKVSDFASATGYDIRTRKVGTSLAIETKGISAHGSTPDAGLNAISILMAFLGELSFVGEEITEWVDYYNERIGFHLHGESIGCALEDEPSGKLVFNVGMMEVNHDMAQMTINIRYPVTYASQDVYDGLEKSLEHTRIGILKEIDEPPVYTPADNPFIQNLLSVYQEETGDREHLPWIDPGGTYSKFFRKMVAFGALFPGETDTMHQPEEYLNLDSWMTMTRIYARMLECICCEEEK